MLLDPKVRCVIVCVVFNFIYMQSNMKLNEEQLATLSSPKAVREYLENQRENIENIIKQNLAVGDIFKRENLEVNIFFKDFIDHKICANYKLMSSSQKTFLIFLFYSFQLKIL